MTHSLIVPTQHKYIFSINPKDRTINWQYEADGVPRGVVATHDTVYATFSSPNHVDAIDIETGDKQWGANVNGKHQNRPLITEDFVYTITHAGIMYRFDIDTGDTVSTQNANRGLAHGPSKCGSVYAASTETIYELQTATSELIGIYNCPSYDNITTTPIAHTFENRAGPLTTRNRLLFIGTQSGMAYSLKIDKSQSAATPESASERIAEKWQFDTGSKIQADPVVTDSRVYFTTRDGRLLALSIETGSLEWEYDAATLYNPPLVTSDRLYFGSPDGGLFALTKDGNKIWSASFNTYITPMLIENVLYIAPSILPQQEQSKLEQLQRRSHNELLGLDPDTGRPLWDISSQSVRQVKLPQTDNGQTSTGGDPTYRPNSDGTSKTVRPPYRNMENTKKTG
jgi:outer membrane protein assembly factor BamB